MKRHGMKQVVSILAVVFLWRVSALAGYPFKTASKEELVAFYAAIREKLAPSDVPFSDEYTQPFIFHPKFGYTVEKEYYTTRLVSIRGQFLIQVDADRMTLKQISNPCLRKYIETNTVQKIPAMSVVQAIGKAKEYMGLLGISLPDNMVASDFSFNFNNKSSWCIRWEPSYGGYVRDNPLSPPKQTISVHFHEKHGFIAYTCRDDYPPPKSTTVVIRQEDAIIKAEKAVPLVFKTPYYQSCRLPGFKVSGVSDVRLMVAAPNWLLDPARAVWMREKLPEESRLCWLITFRTVDTVEREGAPLIPPEVFIYIDAATGEIVGANFT